MQFAVRKQAKTDRFVLSVEGHSSVSGFLTVKAAKAHCWHTHGAVPVHLFGDETEVNLTNPLHLALRRIEARHSGFTSVVAVGSQWYLVRKSKFGAEFRVAYAVRDGIVNARNDFEPLATQKEAA